MGCTDMKNALWIGSLFVLACGAPRGAATGRVVLSQTTVASGTLLIRVLDGPALGVSCATPLQSLVTARDLARVSIPLEARQGRVDNIPVGVGRIFLFQASTAAGELAAIGCKDGVRIDGGVVADLGIIVLNPPPGSVLAFEPTPAQGSVGEVVRLAGKGFPNGFECIEVLFAGKDTSGASVAKSATVVGSSPVEAEVRVPPGALTGPIVARVKGACVQAPIEATSTTIFRVTPSVRSVVYTPTACRAGEATVAGGRTGDIVELRGTGFSPVAADNRIQVTNLPAFRAVWAAPEQTIEGERLDLLRFVVPRGLPAGTLPLSVSVSAGDPNPVLSAAVGFRVLPTLRDVSPGFAPAGGTVTLDMDGAAPDENDNLISFRWTAADQTMAEALTFPTLVSGTALSVLVPRSVGTGVIGGIVAEQCSNDQPFFRANVPSADVARLPAPPADGAAIAVSPLGTHVAGVLQSAVFVRPLAGGQPMAFSLDSPAGPVFAPSGGDVFFLERATRRLVRIDTMAANPALEDVVLTPPLPAIHPKSPLARRGRWLYALTGGALSNVVRIDPATRITRALFGAGGLCHDPLDPFVLGKTIDLIASPNADLLAVIEGDTLAPTSVVLVFASSRGSCVVERVTTPEPAQAIAFDPVEPVAYLARSAEGPVRRASFVEQVGAGGETEVVASHEELPNAVLPAGVRRLIVSPDGGKLFAFVEPPIFALGDNGGSPAIIGRASSELHIVDLSQGATVPLGDSARRAFHSIAIHSVQVSHDSRTLYVPSDSRKDPLAVDSRLETALLYHVDVGAFVADAEGSGVGVSSVAFSTRGAATFASALTPDGSALLLVVSEPQGNVGLAGHVFSFAQRPRGPFRATTFAEERHLDAALTGQERHIVALLPARADTLVRRYRVDSWEAEGADHRLLAYGASPRLFVNRARDLAIIAETASADETDSERRACLLENLSGATLDECRPILRAGSVQRVAFSGPFALLNSRGDSTLRIVNLDVRPLVAIETPLTRPVTDGFPLPGERAVLVHRPVGDGPAEVSLIEFGTRREIDHKPLSGRPGLAAMSPDGNRLLVPLVDSPFVDLVEPTATGLAVTRLPTFGGIHLAATFVQNPAAVSPAPSLSALAFDVLRDGLTRLVFADDAATEGGAVAKGYAVATNPIAVDRSVRVGLTQNDAAMIEVTSNERVAPQVLAPDGRTLWVNTGEHSEIVAVDPLLGTVSARVPLPGSAPQPRRLLPTSDGRYLIVHDVTTGLLQVVDLASR